MRKYFNNKKVICFGEVLWDILPQGKRIGGAPLNVAYHLQKLGIESCVISRIGNDTLGEDIWSFLEGNGLGCSVLQKDRHHVTSTVEAKIGGNYEVVYQILENVAWDFIEYNEDVRRLAEEAEVLVYGSLATRNELTRGTLYKLLESPLIKVLDVNLRAPFYSKDILRKLLNSADIVKMNEMELQFISGWFEIEGGDKEKMKSLADSFGLDALIVTYGASGAWLWQKGKLFFEQAKQIKVADTIGSGDAFLAGFLSEYIQSNSSPKALQTANNMGAFVAQKSGGCPEYNRVEIQ